MLEATAARLASVNAQRLLPELREAQDRHRAAGEEVIASVARGERDTALSTEYFGRDHDFHQVVLNHAGNRYLLEMSANLGALLHRQRQAVHRGVTDVREAIAEHAAIVAAFEAEDADRAVQAMQTHIDLVRIRTHLKLILGKQPVRLQVARPKPGLGCSTQVMQPAFAIRRSISRAL